MQVEILQNPSLNELIPGPVNRHGKSSFHNPITKPRNGANIHSQHEKIENLTIELTALKSLV